MKNRKFALLSLFALLASCGTPASSSSISQEESVSSEESSSVVESSFSSQESTVSKSDFSANPWGEEAAEACYNALNYVIPYIPNSGFEFEEGIDEYGDPMITFYAFFDSDEATNKAFKEYQEICAYQNGFIVDVGMQSYLDRETLTYYEFEIAVGDLRVLEFQGVELIWTVSTRKNRPCLGIFCTQYLYIEPTIFPKMAIDELLGPKNHVPSISGEGYTYKFMYFIDEFGNKDLEIQVYGCDYSIEEEYFNAFLKDGFWLITDNNEEEINYYDEYPGFDYWTYYYALYDFGNLMVCFEYSFDYDAFIIDILPY